MKRSRPAGKGFLKALAKAREDERRARREQPNPPPEPPITEEDIPY